MPPLATERRLGLEGLKRAGVSPPIAEWLQFFDVMQQTARTVAAIGDKFDTLRVQATGSLGAIQKLGLSVAEGLAIAFETFKDAGARIVGGCCGTTPEHLRQIARHIGKSAR